MFKVYHIAKMPDSESIELGMTFKLFKNKYFANDIRIHSSVPAMRAYLQGSKKDVILFNLEHFTLSFVNDPELKDALRVTAEERLTALLKWCFDNQERYKSILEFVDRCESFMLTLVNSVSGKHREEAIMQYRLLIGFVKAELEELKEGDNNVSNKAK